MGNGKINRMNNSDDRRVLAWIWQVSDKEKRNIVFLVLIQSFLGISSVFYAWLFRDVIDTAVSQNLEDFRQSVMKFIGLIVLQIALRSVKRFLDEYTKSGLENRFKERMFGTLLTRDYAQVTAVHSGEWMNRLTSDTVVVADGLTTIVPDLAEMGVKLVGALLAILLMLPMLGYALLPGGLLLLLISHGFRRKSKKLHKKVQEADGRLRVLLSERLSSLLIVRSFAKEEQAVDDVRARMQEHRDVRMERNHFSNICNTGFAGIMNGIYLVGVIFCGYGILKGTMSFGSFTAVLQLIGQIQSPFANMTSYLPKFYGMLASAERLMEVEGFENAVQPQMLDMEMVRAFYHRDFASIVLEDATFTYLPPVQSGEELKSRMPVVLESVNLRINKGDYVAFTGHSGCGKSTILKLLMSLYHLDDGVCDLILTDGTRDRLDARFIRLFAYVPQGNHLMSGSIREIVAFSDQNKMRDDEAIKRALNIACALEFVCALPDGMDTMLGERGLGLSEGQMQRIAIARAVFSGNPILILDESTSALDEDTEQRLLENLRLMTDVTVLIVTHRPAVLEICNRQVLMDEKGIEVRTDGNK